MRLGATHVPLEDGRTVRQYSGMHPLRSLPISSATHCANGQWGPEPKANAESARNAVTNDGRPLKQGAVSARHAMRETGLHGHRAATADRLAAE